MSDTVNLYPCVLGAYREGQLSGRELPIDEALRKRADVAQILEKYAVTQPPNVPYYNILNWPVEAGDVRITPIVSAAFKLGVLLAVWRSVAISTRTPSNEYFRNRHLWDNYGDELVRNLVKKLLPEIGNILENTARRQRETLVRKLPWYLRGSYKAHAPGAFESARSEVFRVAEDVIRGELHSHIDAIVRRPNAAMIDFGESLIRELCASIAPGLDPELFLETVFFAPTDVVEMFVAAYFRECIANSPLRDRQRLWRPDSKAAGRRVFVVHGRDLSLRDRVASILHQSSYEPIVLQREPNRGSTIIEKLESASNCFYAVILLTPDDYGGLRGGSDAMQIASTEGIRARQNVVFELGWFMALLGRDRICCVLSEGLEIPSDISGLAYYRISEAEQVPIEIRRVEE